MIVDSRPGSCMSRIIDFDSGLLSLNWKIYIYMPFFVFFRDERLQTWDVFQTFPPDEDGDRHEALYRLFYKIFRLLTLIVLFVLVLGCAAINKSALLYAASNIAAGALLACTVSSYLPKLGRLCQYWSDFNPVVTCHYGIYIVLTVYRVTFY